MTMLSRLLRPRRDEKAGAALYAQAVDQARRPGFYTRLGVQDRIDARFELYTLHVLLLLRRLDAPSAAGVRQALFEAYISALDDALRELGVGDLSVAKKMRKLGEAVYGRARAYDENLSLDDDSGLAALLARTVFNDEAAAACAEPLAAYVRRAAASLAAQPVEGLLDDGPAWPEVAS